MVIASAYHLCSVHVLCVCVLFVICCVYPACLCVRVCCVTRRALSTLEVDMALLSVSRLVCGAWSLEQNVVLTLSLLIHLIVSCQCVCRMFLSCFVMQDGVRKEELKLNEIRQALAGMSGLETVVLGMWSDVRLRCHYT